MKDADIEPQKFIRSRGMRFPFDPNIITPKQRRLLRNGNYELRELMAVTRMVKPEDTVLELGAGLGFMSTVLSTKCKAKEIHAFEANPGLIPYIQDVHRENSVDNVTLHNAILGKRKGTVDFYVRGEFPASSLEDNMGDEGGGIQSVEKVEVRNVNTTLKEIKPTFLVCDIEGAEADIFTGANLSCLRGAVIETHPQWIGQKGIQAVFDAFQKAGLTFYPKTSNKKVIAFLKDW